MSQMKNQVIEALTPEHGAKVIQYWRSQGVDTGPFRGIMNKADGDLGRYYGVIDGKFASYTLRKVEAAGAEIIELPDDNSDACEMQENLNQVKMKCSYKGDLAGIPDLIVHKMLEHQVLQGNPRDVRVFEKRYYSGILFGGFTWSKTPEGTEFWKEVLEGKNFDTFFERYPELIPDTDTFDIQEALARIEAKLDQLLEDKKRKESDKVCTVEDFKIGDKVRVKSWKEIKAMTKKDECGDRVYSDGGLFLRDKKPACGKIGEVIRSVSDYVPVRGEGWECLLAPQALEKL